MARRLLVHPFLSQWSVESDSGDSLANLFFGPEGAILGRGISNENRWMGIEWETDGSSQWYHPADSGGSSQILAANSEFAGGYETAAGSSKKIGALWSRSSGSSEPVVNFSGVQFKDLQSSQTRFKWSEWSRFFYSRRVAIQNGVSPFDRTADSNDFDDPGYRRG